VQQGENPLDSALSDFLTFDLLDYLDPLKPVLSTIPDATSILSDETFDIDSSLCLLLDLDDFVIVENAGARYRRHRVTCSTC
jgi:hypothetical protein